MTPDITKTAVDLAQDAQGYATGATAAGSGAIPSIRASVDEAKAIATEAAEATRAYAKHAVTATGRKVVDLKGRSADYIADEPVRAVVCAAVGGAVLTALLLAFMRGGRG